MENLHCGQVITLIGLAMNFLGTLLQGIVANKGIPKAGEVIKAPNYTYSICGWCLLSIGFLISMIGVVFS